MITAELNEQVVVCGRRFDPESAVWVQGLSPGSPNFEDACRTLHVMLIKIARRETIRRASALRLSGPEREDIAHQAAADALMRITHKIGDFRGDAQFRTWAFKFVILEVATKVGRHFWRDYRVSPVGDEAYFTPAARR